MDARGCHVTPTIPNRSLGLLCAAGFLACSSGGSQGFTANDAGGLDASADTYVRPIDASMDRGSLFQDASADTLPLDCHPDPLNFDIPGNNCDDDNDGTVDNTPTCDTSLAITGDAFAFANAMGLCQTARSAIDTKWGVIVASYRRGYGDYAPDSGISNDQPPHEGQHGILDRFGASVVPREGVKLGVLSTGFAREFDGDSASSCAAADAGATGCFKPGRLMQSAEQTLRGVPSGFPKIVDTCSSIPKREVFDVIDVRLAIKVPKNARGFSFDFNFWTGEWPEYVCTPYNDGFVAMVESTNLYGGAATNVCFDSRGNPIGVNNAFFDRCTPNTRTGCAPGVGGTPGTSICAGGPGELEGTGFFNPGIWCNPGTLSSGGGATGWLRTAVPVEAGEVIKLDFVIWDTGDPTLDSTVLLDNFRWEAVTVTNQTQRPPR